ncbi:MAG TPA: copper chaperone PCu(A)C [Burkholderiales bacterium]|nr:copper chaperone PCu(A)C [Burkholderiales bacterium]
MKRIAFALAAALAAGLAQAQVEVKDAWVRGMVPGQDTTGAFLSITSKQDARLVGVRTPAAGMAELHRSTMEGGVMRMRPVESLLLPAGTPVELKPGGYHLMLMHVKQALKEGGKVPLTLEIVGADGKRESVTVEAPVLAISASGPGHGMH